MSHLRMLRHNEVLQDSTGSNDAIFEMLHAESFQILRFKVFQQFSGGGGFVNTQSPSPNVKNLLPKLPSNIPRRPRSNSTSWAKNQQFVYMVS